MNPIKISKKTTLILIMLITSSCGNIANLALNGSLKSYNDREIRLRGNLVKTYHIAAENFEYTAITSTNDTVYRTSEFISSSISKTNIHRIKGPIVDSLPCATQSGVSICFNSKNPFRSLTFNIPFVEDKRVEAPTTPIILLDNDGLSYAATLRINKGNALFIINFEKEQGKIFFHKMKQEQISLTYNADAQTFKLGSKQNELTMITDRYTGLVGNTKLSVKFDNPAKYHEIINNLENVTKSKIEYGYTIVEREIEKLNTKHVF
jgi:hypothetical protein